MVLDAQKAAYDYEVIHSAKYLTHDEIVNYTDKAIVLSKVKTGSVYYIAPDGTEPQHPLDPLVKPRLISHFNLSLVSPELHLDVI